jgi:HSP20 family protein
MTMQPSGRRERHDLLAPFDRMVEELFGRTSTGGSPIDVLQTDDGMTIRADVPGIPAEDVVVEVSGTTLTIRGEHEDETEEQEGRFVRRERSSRRFARSVTLPPGADTEHVAARCHDGVLEVNVPIPAERTAIKRITPETA